MNSNTSIILHTSMRIVMLFCFWGLIRCTLYHIPRSNQVHYLDTDLCSGTFWWDQFSCTLCSVIRAWYNLIFFTLLVLPVHIILVCVVLVGAETAPADCVLERDSCVLTAVCVFGHLLHPVEERKEVSQGKSTSLSSSTLYSVNVTTVLISKQGCTVYRWTTSTPNKTHYRDPPPQKEKHTHTHTHMYPKNYVLELSDTEKWCPTQNCNRSL